MVVAHLRAQAARATRQQLTLEEAERPLTTVAGSNEDKEFRELTKEAMKKVGERKKQASERAHIEEVEAREKSQEDKYASKEKAEREKAAGIEPDQHDTEGAAVLGAQGGQPSNGGGKQPNINSAYLHLTGGETQGPSPSISALPKMLVDAAAAAAAEVHVGSRAAAAIASAYVQHKPRPRQEASNTLLTDARSVVQALESEGSIILQGSELEMRRVAEVMLVHLRRKKKLMCPHSTRYVLIVLYILILLYMCGRTTMYTSGDARPRSEGAHVPETQRRPLEEFQIHCGQRR
jgi:hypothetical protein